MMIFALRMLGGILVLLAGVGGGYQYGRTLQMYLENLKELRRIIGMIQSELHYTQATLSDVFWRVSERTGEPYQGWLRHMRACILEYDAQTFEQIWVNSVEECLKSLPWTMEHQCLLGKLGSGLGQADVGSEVKTLQLCLEELDEEIEKYKEYSKNRIRLVRCISISAGLFLVIILM